MAKNESARIDKINNNKNKKSTMVAGMYLDIAKYTLTVGIVGIMTTSGLGYYWIIGILICTFFAFFALAHITLKDEDDRN